MNSVSNKKILVVTEGIKDEPQVFKKLSEIFGLSSNIEIVSYGTNIHQLIYALEKESNLEDVDIQLLLREIERKRSKSPDEIQKLNDNYTDKIFIFDLDAHDSGYDSSKLFRLLEAMNDSTGDLGKLFINYPMWESYYFSNTDTDQLHFPANSRKGQFKELAHKREEWKLYNKNLLDDGRYKSLVNVQAKKYEIILGREYDGESGIDLYQHQTVDISKNQIAIINSSVLFFIDYLGKSKVLCK